MAASGSAALGDEMADAIAAWLATPAGQLVLAVGAHLRRRAGWIAWGALLLFAVAWPLSGSAMNWLIEDAGLLPESTAAPVEHEVTLGADGGFVPALVTVTEGDTVRWRWANRTAANVASVANATAASHDGVWRSGDPATSLNVSLEFETAGPFHYVDEAGGLRGEVDVQRPGGLRLVVLTPVELMLLKLRLCVIATIAVLVLALLADGGWQLARSGEVRARLSELDWRLPRPGLQLGVTVTSSLLLAVAGGAYALRVVTPLVLQELQQDAIAAGLDTTWRLGDAIGFIGGLALGGIVGFQVPVAVLLARRTGLVPRADLVRYRRHLWFAAFVLGAILTPPDPLSMVLVAAPMVLLLEVALLIDLVWPGPEPPAAPPLVDDHASS